MPFTKDDFTLFIDTRTQDANFAKVSDLTSYGGVNQLRNSTANILVAAKMDENQNLTFIPNILNNLPLSAIEWEFATASDGAYRLFLMVFKLYDNVANYVGETLNLDGTIAQYADVIYHSSDSTFYKAKSAVSGVEPGVTVGWQTYWDVFTSFSSYVLSDRTTVVIHIHDDVVTFRFEDCLKDELVSITDDILCGVCDKFDDLLKVVQMTLVLDETNSENWQNKQTRAEVILSEGYKKFCC